MADAVGYSRLMERDETATNARLRERRGLIAAKAAEYGGRLVDTAGDGLLLEFPSAAFAVRFAIAVQREMRVRDRKRSEDGRIQFRIGINVGDVIVDGHTIAGNGVNVAARLEALAEPGGICVSASVLEQLHDDLGVDYIDLGEQRVKNLERPVRVFRIAPSARTRAPTARPGGAAVAAPIAAGNRRSIAVLPFLNLTEDPASEHFADGLAEEILSALANIPGLRVVSRTSSFYFKGRNPDLATVAAKLGVDLVLEGSVRGSGNRIRVAVQLIHVPSDSHVWARSYERTLDDVFAIQDGIARAIARELSRGISAPDERFAEETSAAIEQSSKGRTTNAEALRLYLEGRYFAARQTRADTARALEHLERALAIDSRFALAWTALAAAHATQAGYGGNVSVAEGFRRARAAAQRALALEPDLPNAHAILAWIQLYRDWDWAAAERSARRALALAPNNTRVLLTVSTVLGNLGHDAEFTALVRRAAQLDPLDATIHRQVAMIELDALNLEEADTALMRALECDAELGLANYVLGSIRMAQGRLPEAVAAFERETLDDYRLLGLVLARHAQGLQVECGAALKELIERHGASSPCQVATAYAFCGEPEPAFDWLDRAYAACDPRLVEVRDDPMLRRLHQHPRWKSFLAKMGFTV